MEVIYQKNFVMENEILFYSICGIVVAITIACLVFAWKEVKKEKE